MLSEVEEITLNKKPEEILREIDYLTQFIGESPGGTIIGLLQEKLLEIGRFDKLNNLL